MDKIPFSSRIDPLLVLGIIYFFNFSFFNATVLSRSFDSSIHRSSPSSFM